MGSPGVSEVGLGREGLKLLNFKYKKVEKRTGLKINVLTCSCWSTSRVMQNQRRREQGALIKESMLCRIETIEQYSGV